MTLTVLIFFGFGLSLVMTLIEPFLNFLKWFKDDGARLAARNERMGLTYMNQKPDKGFMGVFR